MVYPRIQQGAIVRSRKNTLLKQEDDFLAVSNTNTRFHISEQLADLLKIIDGTLSINEINSMYGYDCSQILKKLLDYGIVEFNDYSILNEHHSRQFIELSNLSVACQTVIWHTTRKCNLKCSHCYYLYGKEVKEDFSINEIDTICKSIAELGCEMVILSGGEILSNKKTFQAVTDRLIALCIPFRINTNATFNCEEIIKVFNKSKYAKLIQVSLDGTEDIHDKLRGVKGSFQKTIESIKLFKTNGIYVRVVSMLTNEWLKKETLLDFANLLSEIEVDQWFIEVPSFTGRWNRSIEVNYIPELTNFSKELISYCTSNNHNFKEVIFNQIFSYPYRDYIAKSLEDTICSHDIGLLSFGAEGVSYCTLFREQFGENWKDFEDPTQLSRAWEKISSFRMSKRIVDNTTCKNCELFNICQGGCPGQYSDSQNFQGCDYHSKLLALVKKSLISEGYGRSEISLN